MFILTQFVFRLSFGLALGMAVTSPRQVTSGYYRNHLYVLLGLNALAAMAALLAPEHSFWLAPVSAAVLSYVGSVVWLYEKPRAGIAILALVAAASLWGAWTTMNPPLNSPLALSAAAADQTAADKTAVDQTFIDEDEPDETAAEQAAWWLRLLDPVTGGLVLGVTMAAMFLGHWYLNTPTMVLAPLQRLVQLMAVAIAARAVVCGVGLALAAPRLNATGMHSVVFLSLHWLSGLAAAALLTGMTWQTLKIPNTQSATGILYVAVIATFLGELASLLLSQGSMVPL